MFKMNLSPGPQIPRASWKSGVWSVFLPRGQVRVQSLSETIHQKLGREGPHSPGTLRRQEVSLHHVWEKVSWERIVLLFLPWCTFRFKESTHLRKHLYTHTGERPHFCALCSKGFQTSSDLKRHKKTRVHQEKVEQAGQNAIAATAAQPQPDLNLEYNDWTDTTAEDKDLGAGPGSIQNTFTVSSNSSSTSLPFSHTESSSVQSLVSVTTSSTNYINQNTEPYTTNHHTQDQKPLWSPEVGDATISSLMLSPNLITNSVSPASLQVQNCSLPSTTLDLSDIKWGILDQEPIKRETGGLSAEKQLTIQNIQWTLPWLLVMYQIVWRAKSSDQSTDIKSFSPHVSDLILSVKIWIWIKQMLTMTMISATNPISNASHPIPHFHPYLVDFNNKVLSIPRTRDWIVFNVTTFLEVWLRRAVSLRLLAYQFITLFMYFTQIVLPNCDLLW